MHSFGESPSLHRPWNVAICTGPKAHANARLIAAAPDMANALRVIIKQAETTRLAFPNAAGRDDWQQVILISRAALTKAEGKQ